MTEPRPTERGTARTIVYVPGNGTQYHIVYGPDFVALPAFRAAATMTPWPSDWGYIADKLDLSRPDAEAVFEALREEGARLEDERLLRKFNDDEDAV